MEVVGAGHKVVSKPRGVLEWQHIVLPFGLARVAQLGGVVWFDDAQPKRPRIAARDVRDLRGDGLLEVVAASRVEVDLHCDEGSELLASPLPAKIGLSSEQFELVVSHTDEQTANKIFKIDDRAPRFKLWEFLWFHLLEPLEYDGSSEVEFIGIYGAIFGRPLAAAFDGARVSLSRNRAQCGSTGREWCDFLFSLDEICVFRGEEQWVISEYIIVMAEFSTNLEWSCGRNVPYIFGYAAGRCTVKFYAIVSFERSVKTILIGTCDTQCVKERLKVVHASLQLSRLFRGIVDLHPDAAWRPVATIIRPNGVIVDLDPTHVERNFAKARTENGGEFDVLQLKQTYKTLASFPIRNMERLRRTSACGFIFTFEPRGVDELPKSLDELFCALKCVLGVLEALHDRGWMHRDICWSNVTKHQESDELWVLIDFAHAATSPQEQPPNGFCLVRSDHAPEWFVEGGAHTTAVDVWGVGHLIHVWERQTIHQSWTAHPERKLFLDHLLRQ